MKRFLSEEESTGKKQDREVQDNFHRRAGTHPGSGWYWRTNCSDSEIEKRRDEYIESCGKDNVQILETAFYADGSPAPAGWHSLWIKQG